MGPLLTSHGYTVLAAMGGEEALQLADAHRGPIHLLLTHVVMRGMSGRALARAITVRRPDIRTLYVSRYADDAMVHHGVLDAGMAFLQKPFTPQALAHKVREVLDASQPRPLAGPA